MTHEKLFDPADVSFDQCHAATLAQLPDGDVLAAWFAGTTEGRDDVGIQVARRSEGAWSAPRQLPRVRQEPHWNPVLFHPPGDTVYLFFKVGKPIPDWETWVATSGDGGITWTDARPLVPGDRGGRGPVKNKPIVLSDGSWLAPASLQVHYPDRKIWDVFTDRSDDKGKTWAASDLVRIDHETFPGAGLIQPTLWESAPGIVHMLARSSCGFLCRADSRDFGQTWTDARRTDIPNNNSGVDLVSLPGGTLAMVYNPVAENWGARTPLRLALSYDNGHTWPHALDLETGEGEFSYPSIIACGEKLCTTYTWKRQSIAFWEGTAEELKACSESRSRKS